MSQNNPLTKYLIPKPKKITFTGKTIELPEVILLALPGEGLIPQPIIRRAISFCNTLKIPHQLISNYSNLTPTRRELLFKIDLKPHLFPTPETYRLQLSKTKGLEITASDRRGLLWGLQTLNQISQLMTDFPELFDFNLGLPELTILDWPDFAHRGVMLDISRNKVPTQETLKNLTSLLSSLKINQLQLYTEHTFAYRGYEFVWKDSSPLTPQEVRELVQWTSEHQIELVPNQNSFGHFHRWLKHPQHRDLAEFPEGIEHA